LKKTIEKPENERMLRGRHQCPHCGSSDSLGYYEENAHCYGSCNETFWYKKGERVESIEFEEEVVTLDDIRSLPFRGREDRNITAQVAEFYGATSDVGEDGKPASWYFPWTQKGVITTYKQKTPEKKFYLKGDTKLVKNKNAELFGQSLFSKGGKTLVITEGELDAMAIQRAYLLKYKRTFPTVSMFNATSNELIVNNLDYIKSFEKIIIWGDNDNPGKVAIEKAAKAIGAGKVHIVDNGKYKDANEALVNENHEYIIQRIWNASLWNPSGFVSGMDIWKKFQEHKNKPSIPFPICFPELNRLLTGLRTGEITLFTSGTGSGKSTVIKEILINITERDQDALIGIVSLEEEVGETSGKMIEMDLKHELIRAEDGEEDPEQLESFKKLFLKPDGSDRIIIVDHQGSLGDDSLMDKMNQLASMGCKYIILDHITIAVSEGNSGLTGNEATDKMMSDLLKLVKSHDVWLGLISHLRKVGSGAKSFEEGHMASMDDIKGSGSIKQISFDIVAFARNMTAESEEERNTIKLSVLKARYTGRTGPAGSAYYDDKTRRLRYIDPMSNKRIDDMFDVETSEEERIGL
jgi:twinkle protein